MAILYNNNNNNHDDDDSMIALLFSPWKRHQVGQDKQFVSIWKERGAILIIIMKHGIASAFTIFFGWLKVLKKIDHVTGTIQRSCDAIFVS